MAGAAALSDAEALLPSEEQAEVVDFLERLAAKRDAGTTPSARLVGADGRGVDIPASLFSVLVLVADSLKRGIAVTVAPQHMVLSTQEAADLLRISRTTLVRLLESGAIPFDKPSRHRKVRLQDLLEYRKRQRVAAEQALDDLMSDAQRLGLYDADPQDISDALRAARRGVAAD